MKARSTEETVLAGVWLTACDPGTRHLVDKETADYSSLALRAIGSPLEWLLKSSFVRWFARRQESKTLPGICGHYVARKKEIACIVDELRPQRLTVLGAGLDDLAYRLANKLEAVEVARSDSQMRKKLILQQLPQRPLTLIVGDISSPDFRLLEPSGREVVVIEGVLMYLYEQQVANLLVNLLASDRIVVFTFMGVDELGRPSFGMPQAKVDKYLASAREPFRWGVNPAGLEPFLAETGWALVSLAGAPLPTSKVKEIPHMIEGEWIAHAIPKREHI